MGKSQKTKLAEKKKKEKKIVTIIITLSFLIVIVVAELLFFNFFVNPAPWEPLQIDNRNMTRTYVLGNASVILDGEFQGQFMAALWHDRTIMGYFEINPNTDRITFYHSENRRHRGHLEESILTIPSEWDDRHNHGREFILSG
jgi:hypothetical protein